MAGTPTGCVEIYTTTPTTYEQHFNIAFKNIYDTMVAHPSASIVSLYYGNAGTGTDYYDGVSPFLNGAFFVVKMPANVNRDYDYYWMCQYKATAAATGNALPFLINNGTNTGIGFAICAVSGSTENPWNGTLNNDGTDSKGSPVWAATTGSLILIPASNNTGNTHGTNKENCIGVTNAATTTIVSHFVCDNDHVFYGTNGNIAYPLMNYFTYFGPYKTHQQIASGAVRLYGVSSLGNATPIVRNNSYANDNTQGVSLVNSGSNYSDRSFILTSAKSIDTNYFPAANMFGAYQELDWNLYVRNTTTDTYGLLGQYGHEFIGRIMNVASGDVKTGYTRAYFGTTTLADMKLGIPWDGFTVPGSGTSRTGSYF